MTNDPEAETGQLEKKIQFCVVLEEWFVFEVKKGGFGRKQDSDVLFCTVFVCYFGLYLSLSLSMATYICRYGVVWLLCVVCER